MATPTFTNAQYLAIKAAYAQGVLRVEYGDKVIEYRSLREMQQIISDIEVDLGIKNRVRTRYIEHKKGLL